MGKEQGRKVRHTAVLLLLDVGLSFVLPYMRSVFVMPAGSLSDNRRKKSTIGKAHQKPAARISSSALCLRLLVDRGMNKNGKRKLPPLVLLNNRVVRERSTRCSVTHTPSGAAAFALID